MPAPSGPDVRVADVRTAPPPSEFAANEALKPIFFDFDKSDIRQDAAQILEENAKWLGANPKQLVLIEGHCDSRGTNEYNLALGERRAHSAANFLIGRGVAAGRITVLSYGEERPSCEDETEGCWAKNRRASFLTKPQP
jgi:peptidoglycan-associated lipoprotein